LNMFGLQFSPSSIMEPLSGSVIWFMIRLRMFSSTIWT
jgi:hypothetical protein